MPIRVQITVWCDAPKCRHRFTPTTEFLDEEWGVPRGWTKIFVGGGRWPLFDYFCAEHSHLEHVCPHGNVRGDIKNVVAGGKLVCGCETNLRAPRSRSTSTPRPLRFEDEHNICPVCHQTPIPVPRERLPSARVCVECGTEISHHLPGRFGVDDV